MFILDNVILDLVIICQSALSDSTRECPSGGGLALRQLVTGPNPH